ncbi:MAG: uracil-DNA glycosylase [Pseudomonadota bacterium]
MSDLRSTTLGSMSYWEMRAALEWQIAMGVDEAILVAPIDRTEAPKPVENTVSAVQPSEALSMDPVSVAMKLAEEAKDLEALKSAMQAYDHCDLKRGAKQLVFSDGQVGAPVMIIGEAPGRDEDIEGRPFVGRAGKLLDLMFSHVGLSRQTADVQKSLYIANVLPWRPPQNRDPKPDEMAMMLPFLLKHITIANPKIVVAMGNHACQALIGKRGITRLRGSWNEALGKPVLPMFHPAYLLRTPEAKREAWADLLALRAKVDSVSG